MTKLQNKSIRSRPTHKRLIVSVPVWLDLEFLYAAVTRATVLVCLWRRWWVQTPSI